MAGTEAPDRLRELIRGELAAAGGALPFARFMALALYAPRLGYYERGPAAVGRGGDFFTSVSVGPLFGELLAFRFAGWLAAEPRSQISDLRFQIVEAGAHDGRLARDILGWLRRWRPELSERVGYVLVEPSPVRRAWQAATLAEFANQVSWVAEIAELRAPGCGRFPPETAAGRADFPVRRAGCGAARPQTTGLTAASIGPVSDDSAEGSSAPGSVRGVLFANELLDAFPVHRLGWDAAAGRWFEWGVAAVGDGFGWTRLDADRSSVPPDAWPKLPAGLLAVLPDGFSTEVCPAATAWWRAAAGTLAEGHLVTLDYGLTTEEFFEPQRAAGTLRGYHRHRFVDDLLANPGDQDLTAQVDFSALLAAGEAAGLRTAAFTSQRRWLTEVMAETLAPGAGFAPWDAARTRQFQTLTHPEHLGRAFRVLAQQRGGGGSDAS